MSRSATVVVPVGGMTCQACTSRVRRHLERVEGVASAAVSLSRSRAVVTTTHPVEPAALEAAVRHAGYEPSTPGLPWLARESRVWRDVVVSAVVIAALVVLAVRLGLDERLGGLGVLATGGSLVMVAVVGVTAGFSTCMALVGGLVLAVSARQAQRRTAQDTAPTTWQRLRPQVAFNVGRLLGFAAFGALLGGLGSWATLSGPALAALMILTGGVTALVGVRLTGVSPRLAALSPTLPPRLASLASRQVATPALAGAATFFLPCGFTQAIQVYALATGSPLQAALVMTLFALGTLPGLAVAGGAPALLRRPGAGTTFRVAGVAVLAMSAVTVVGATDLLRIGSVGELTASRSVTENVELVDGVQVLTTQQHLGGYSPHASTVVVGRPVRWEITSEVFSCASALYAPVAGVTTPLGLQPGLNVVEFTPQETGTFTYSCSMGMWEANLTVVPDPAAAR